MSEIESMMSESLGSIVVDMLNKQLVKSKSAECWWTENFESWVERELYNYAASKLVERRTLGMMAEACSRSLEDGLSQKVPKHSSQTRISLKTVKGKQTMRWRLTRWMLGMEEVFQWTEWSSSCEKTSKYQILNISFCTMDLKFLESVIIDYLIWVESYTVYVLWIHNNSNFTDTGERVGHFFCRCCLKSEMGTQNSVRCPTCRTTHGGGLDQIPRNFALVANISYYNQKIEKVASDVIHKIQRRIASRIKSARSRIRENAIAHEKLVLNLADSKAKIVALLTEKFYRKILQNVCCIVEVFSWFRNPELDEAIRKNWNLKRESIWWLTDDSSRLELWAVLCGWSLVTPSSIHVEKKKQAAIQKLTKTSW